MINIYNHQEEAIARREKYLKKLGVVQYRRRSLTVTQVLRVQSEPQALPSNIQDSAQNSAQTQPSERSLLDKKERASLFERIPAEQKVTSPISPNENSSNTVNNLKEPSTEVGIVDKRREEISELKARSSENVSNTNADSPAFDLLIWRAKGLLVLDFSQLENDELTASKHVLTNNILRAIWPTEFKGCEMYQHSWPIKGIPGDAESGRQWFQSLVSGFRQQGESTPIFLMGEPGLDLIFYDRRSEPSSLEIDHSASAYNSLIGTAIRHERLETEFLIGPSLSDMLESTVAKVQAWQLLKILR